MYPIESSAEEDTTKLWWEPAYDFENNYITYDLQVSSTPDMQNLIVNEKGLDNTTYYVSKDIMPAGTWYWQVTATSEDGKTVESMNKIRINGTYYPGVDIVEVN